MFNLKDYLITFQKTMKLKEIIDSIDSIQYFMGLKLPAITSYKLAVFAKKVNPEVEAFSKIRNEKLKEYGDEVKDEKGDFNGNYNIPKKNIGKFNEEMNKLLEAEIKMDIPEINIKDFEGLEIEPKYFIELGWLIKS
jgi:hypothetical protein